MVLVWYPIGVEKLVDAAKHMAIRNGFGSIFSEAAIEIAIGASRTAAALLVINSVSTAAIK